MGDIVESTTIREYLEGLDVSVTPYNKYISIHERK